MEEAALTGESVPVQKNADLRLEADVPLGDRKNTAFMGTLVNSGRGRGVVVGTGMHTQIGLIADMLQSVEEEATPLQKRLDDLGKILGWAALAVCALVFVVGLLRGHAPLEMFMLAVGLAIAAVPEGLPAVVTISLALGMREMIKRHALIRRLSSVETLGSTTVICSDKTGTLTQNKMTVTRLWVDGQFLDGHAARATPWPANSWTASKPVDLADYPGHADRPVGRRPEQRRPAWRSPAKATARAAPTAWWATRPKGPCWWRRPRPALCRDRSTRPTRAWPRSPSTRRARAWSPSTTSIDPAAGGHFALRRKPQGQRLRRSPSRARRTWC